MRSPTITLSFLLAVLLRHSVSLPSTSGLNPNFGQSYVQDSDTPKVRRSNEASEQLPGPVQDVLVRRAPRTAQLGPSKILDEKLSIVGIPTELSPKPHHQTHRSLRPSQQFPDSAADLLNRRAPRTATLGPDQILDSAKVYVVGTPEEIPPKVHNKKRRFVGPSQQLPGQSSVQDVLNRRAAHPIVSPTTSSSGQNINVVGVPSDHAPNLPRKRLVRPLSFIGWNQGYGATPVTESSQAGFGQQAGLGKQAGFDFTTGPNLYNSSPQKLNGVDGSGWPTGYSLPQAPTSKVLSKH